MLPFFAEIAKRMGISTKDISYVRTSEVINFLKNNVTISSGFIRDRKKGFVMYLNDQSKIVCLQGDIVQEVLTIFHLSNKTKVINEIKGMVASRGKAIGKVAIIHGIKDLSKVTNGSILVAITTHPDYMIAMRKAAAIITDEGGITCHAAIVSREYNIPCIVVTQNATKILKDNDTVEVNAIEGWVKKITN